jgi:uncharacterized protein YegL
METLIDRKCAFYLVVELSRRLSAKDCDELRQVFRDFVRESRMDPHALETLWISVVEGACTASVSLPLTSLVDLGDTMVFTNREPVETSLASLLRAVSGRITQEITIRTATPKGDYRPVVLLLLAGPPPDEDQAINELNQLAKQPSNPIVLMATTSDLSFSEPFCQCLLDSPLRADLITGEMIYRAWSYYAPCGVFWDSWSPPTSKLP